MASQDFSLYSGDTKILTVTVIDSSNNAVNLTNATIKWALMSGTSVVLQKSTPNGIAITDAAAGQCTISLTSTDTQNLSGTYTHEARLIDSSKNSGVIFVGNVTVTKSHV